MKTPFYTIESLPVYEDGQSRRCDYRMIVWDDYRATLENREVLDVVEAMDVSTLLDYSRDVHPEAKLLKALGEERA